MKEEYKEIIMNLACTEKLMPSIEYVVSDEDIISQIKLLRNIEETDKDGRTLMMYAVIYERIEIVSYFLRQGVSVNVKDKNGFTPLHFAAKSGNLKVLSLLLDAGADVNEKNTMGNSPIMLCNNATDIRVYEMLILHGTNPIQKNNYGVSAVDIFSNIFSSSRVISEVLENRK